MRILISRPIIALWLLSYITRILTCPASKAALLGLMSLIESVDYAWVLRVHFLSRG